MAKFLEEKIQSSLWGPAAFLVLCGLFGFAGNAKATAGVHKCSNKTLKCAVYLNEGSYGDIVHILDERARFVAEGRILKKIVRKRRPVAIIKILRPGSMRKMIQKAYPVVLEAKSPCKYEDHYKHLRKVKKTYPHLVNKSRFKIAPKKDKRLSSLKRESRSRELIADSSYYDY